MASSPAPDDSVLSEYIKNDVGGRWLASQWKCADELWPESGRSTPLSVTARARSLSDLGDRSESGWGRDESANERDKRGHTDAPRRTVPEGGGWSEYRSSFKVGETTGPT